MSACLHPRIGIAATRYLEYVTDVDGWEPFSGEPCQFANPSFQWSIDAMSGNDEGNPETISPSAQQRQNQPSGTVDIWEASRKGDRRRHVDTIDGVHNSLTTPRVSAMRCNTYYMLQLPRTV